MVEVVKFETPNCGPCKWVQLTLDRIENELKGQPIAFTRVDASVEQERTQSLNITKAPTVVVFKDGQEIHRFVGAIYNQNDYLAIIEPLLRSDADVDASL